MINRTIDKLLYRYDSSSYTVKNRARFLLFSIITLLSVTTILLISQSYLNLHNPAYNYKIQLKIVGPLAAAFILDIFLLFLLFKGYFSITGNLLLIICQTGIWTVMYLSKAELTVRIDSIVLIAATLSMMPIIINRRKKLFLIYTIINIALLFLFIWLYKNDLNLTGAATTDYLTDNTIAFLFIGIIAYTIYSINTKALEKAESEIAERERVEDQRNKLQMQLLQSQKLESIGLLAGGVAHDFNNMLAAVQGFAELAKAGIDEQINVKPEIIEIIKASKKARDLTHQLLAFARIQPLNMRKININVIIDDFTCMLSRTLRENIVIQNNLCEISGIIEGDPIQIEQILLNLALNAQDAMPSGGTITIETKIVKIDENFIEKFENIIPGKYILLSISDSGSGIDPDIIDKIFDPFYTTKDVGKGTGLGLSTVYGIVKQHNGMIHLYSEKNKGAIFKIYLPVIEGSTDEENLPSISLKSLNGDETILAVEDNPEVRTLLETILNKSGYKTLMAGNAETALNIASSYEGPIHLLITDVVIPDMNGMQLCNKIVELRPDIKVIYISGYTSNVIAHNGILDEGINFIQKPFSISDFTSRVRDVLDM